MFDTVEVVKRMHHFLEARFVAKAPAAPVDRDRARVGHAMQADREKLVAAFRNRAADQQAVVHRQAIDGRAEFGREDHAVAFVGRRERIEPVGKALETPDQVGIAFVAAGGEHHAAACAQRGRVVTGVDAADAAVFDHQAGDALPQAQRHTQFQAGHQQLRHQRLACAQLAIARAPRQFFLVPVPAVGKPAPARNVAPTHAGRHVVRGAQRVGPGAERGATDRRRFDHPATVGPAAWRGGMEGFGQPHRQLKRHAMAAQAVERARRFAHIGVEACRKPGAAGRMLRVGQALREAVGEAGFARQCVVGDPQGAVRGRRATADLAALLQQAHRQAAAGRGKGGGQAGRAGACDDQIECAACHCVPLPFHSLRGIAGCDRQCYFRTPGPVRIFPGQAARRLAY